MILATTTRLILETSHIEEVVQDFLSLHRNGSNLVALCPFHHEKTPSFNVSPTRNIFKCFGCGKGGNAARFLMEHEGFSFPEALCWLAKKYHIEIQEVEPTLEQLAIQQEEESLFIVNGFAKKFFQSNLPGRGLDYFKSRGFTEATTQKFGLGFAPESWDALTKAAAQAGFKTGYLKKLGLATQSGKDFFRNRAIFPIHNLGGKVIAFAGRILQPEANVPKYLNSPESDLYQKSKTLYGIHLARKAIRLQDECILVEGYTDLISLHQAGIENVAASAGTALTVEQLLLIRRFSKNITLLYDGDPAGIKAASRGLDLALEQDMNVKIVPLPHPDDPDSFLRKVGIAVFREFIHSQAKGFIQFKTSLLLKEANNDPVKKAAIVHGMVESIARIPDPIKRSFFVRECAALVDLAKGVLMQETNKAVMALERKLPPAVPKVTISAEHPPLRIEGLERHLTYLLLEHGVEMLDPTENFTVAEHILGNIGDILEHFADPLCQRICRESTNLVLEKKPVTAQYFTAHEDLDMSSFTAGLVQVNTARPDPHWEQANYFPANNQTKKGYMDDIEKTISHLKLNTVNLLCEQNLQRIKDAPPGDEQAMARLLKVQEKLNAMRKELAKDLGLVKF